jgi:hypothetical protein
VILKPGKTGRYDKEGGAFLSINSLGYRDVEHTREKPAGVFRIAVLGDSFAEARQVELEDTFWKVLEARLNESGELGGTRFEVLNFGVGGYGQVEELLTLRKDAIPFQPDLVLLGFFVSNDLVNNLKSLSIRLRGEDFRPFYELVGDDLVLDQSFRDPGWSNYRYRFILEATHHSRLLEVANQIRRLVAVRLWRQEQEKAQRVDAEDRETEWGVAEAELGISDTHFVPPQDDEWKRAWAVTEALLSEIHRETSSIGATLVLATMTDPAQVHPDPEWRERFARRLGAEDLFYVEDRLARIAACEGFIFVDTTRPLQAEATRTGKYLHGFENTVLGTGHWNEQAHAVA